MPERPPPTPPAEWLSSGSKADLAESWDKEAGKGDSECPFLPKFFYLEGKTQKFLRNWNMGIAAPYY